MVLRRHTYVGDSAGWGPWNQTLDLEGVQYEEAHNERSQAHRQDKVKQFTLVHTRILPDKE